MQTNHIGFQDDSIVYRPEIDGLRTLAVSIVILYHASVPGFSGGFVGVDVFFVISGYLITRIILKDHRTGDFSFFNFWIRRARRILPILLFVLITTLLLSLALKTPLDLKNFSLSLTSSALFVSNIYFSLNEGGYFLLPANQTPLLHIWSLALEEQFYLIYPMVLIFLVKFGSRFFQLLLAIFIASLLSSIFLVEIYPVTTFYHLHTRAWELLAGALCVFVRKQSGTLSNATVGSICLLGIGFIIGPVIFYDSDTIFPGISAIFPVLGSSILIVFMGQDDIVTKIFRLRIMIFVGLLSYGAYLWHQPLLVFGKVLLDSWSLETRIFLALLSLPLAWLSYVVVEQPFRRSRHGQNIRFLIGLAATIGIVAGAGIWLRMSDGFPDRFPASVTRAESDREMLNLCLANVKGEPPTGGLCERGVKGKVTMAMLGDSHGASLAPGFDELLAENGLGMRLHTMRGCLPIFSEFPIVGVTPGCSRFVRRSIREISSNSEIQTVVIAARWTARLEGDRFDNGEGGVWGNDHGSMRQVTPESQFKQALMATIKKLRDAGKKVVLIGPVPEVGWHVPAFIARRSTLGLSTDEVFTTSFDSYKSRNASSISIIENSISGNDVVVLDPARGLCPEAIYRRCVFVNGNSLLYMDADHLSGEGARIALRSEVAKIDIASD